jgi:signal transduction histidine kinase
MKSSPECDPLAPSDTFLREVQIEYLIHELKDPLAVAEVGVRSLLERKDKYGSLSARQEKVLDRSLRNLKKARTMLYDLLEVGRSEAGCFRYCCFLPGETLYAALLDALEVMDDPVFKGCRRCRRRSESIHFLANNGIVLKIEPQVSDIEIEQDETKFRQIVGNLIKNSLHHRNKQVEIRMVKTPDHLRIEVCDDGPGIATQDHERIFQRYAQLSKSSCSSFVRPGHGLGLTGSRILARKLGGDIQITSQPGQGATFLLILPTSRKTGV